MHKRVAFLYLYIVYTLRATKQQRKKSIYCMLCSVTLAIGAAALGVIPDFGPNFNASSLPNMNGDFILSKMPGADMSK